MHDLPRGRRPSPTPPRPAVSARRFGTALLPACAAWLCGATAAQAQSQLGPEDLRGSLESLLPSAPQPSIERAWVVQPSIGIDVGVTDNPGGTGQGGRTSFLAIISPTLAIQGDTSRATVRLNYSPTATFYVPDGSQSRVDQNFAGSALLTIVPETLFLDVRGLVDQQSRTGQSSYGAFGQQNSLLLSKQDDVQSASFSVTPYLQHRFGGWGTAKVGYSYARTFQDADNNNFNTFNNSNTLGYGITGNLQTQRERASFVTGENFGRFNDEITASATQYSGDGSYRGAYRNEINNEFGYAVTRTITLLAGVGYQNLRYSGSPGYRLDEPTWNVGTRLTPQPDSSITILYGRHDGGTQISFQGAYSPTARTRLFGSYTTGISTNTEDQQNLLDTTSVGPGGLLVDNVTGAPVASGSSFGLQNTLSRVRRLSATGLLLLDRDSFSLTVTNEDDTTLTNSSSFLGTAIPAGTKTNSTNATLGWQHDINPTTSVSATVSYGIVDNGAYLGNPSAGNQTIFGVTAGVSHIFTETLTGHVNYSYSERSGGQGNNIPAYLGGNTSQNTLLAGIRKSF